MGLRRTGKQTAHWAAPVPTDEPRDAAEQGLTHAGRPERASGFELCGRLREGEPGRRWNRDVPVMVSSRGDPIDRVRGFARGCDDYVVNAL